MLTFKRKVLILAFFTLYIIIANSLGWCEAQIIALVFAHSE